MKFTCDKATLQREIAFVQEIISSRSSISILSNVYFQAENNTLEIKATDLKVNFVTSIPVEIQESGITTIFCDKLFGILSNLPDGDISFEVAENKVVIKPLFKKIKFQLKTINPDNFPEFPSVDENNYFSIPSSSFKNMILNTVFSVSDDETRYFMNGVYLEKKENTLVMVATDGRRLAYISKQPESVLPDFKSVIIPPKILNIIQKHGGDDNIIQIALSDKNLFIKFSNYHLSSVLIEGQFPNYQRVIPESQQYNVTIKKSELMESLKRVAILVEQKSRKTFLTFSNGILSISTDESEFGNAKEEINCSYDGPEMMIALNYRYIEEPLKVLQTEDVDLEFTEGTRVLSLYPNPRSDFFHIITSMQLD